MKTAVALILYKRPELTRRVWSEIRKARPLRLFVIADGPRNEEERAICEECRAIVERVDWNCEVLKNYASWNMGCKRRVATGLDWVFKQVEEAVILEDDCVPDQSFFTYCEEMLDRYRHDERVMHISGSNFLHKLISVESDHYYSKYTLVWGWATWRRAWKHFDLQMKAWPDFRSSSQLARVCPLPDELPYWQDVFDMVYEGQTESWAFVWQYCCLLLGGLAITPAVNLVSNIGTGTDATHRNDGAWYMKLPAERWASSPHETAVARNQQADDIVFRNVFLRPKETRIRGAMFALKSPWYYGSMIRKIPVIGRIWGSLRERMKGNSPRRDGMPAAGDVTACPPVLFLMFNRPRLSAQVFRRIREARPSRLFIAADGPRPTHPDDVALCEATRCVVEGIDWPCEVQHLYAEKNLGCRQAVVAGINWMFEHVPEAIILEDDCVPDPSFFRYCGVLLERYRGDSRVMHIGGNNFLRNKLNVKASYYFSKYSHIWGWATWRRAWLHYDGDMRSWPAFRDSARLANICPDPEECAYWTRNFDLAYDGKVDTWDFAWQYTCWKHGGLSAVPSVNLVMNTGAGKDATHTNMTAWYLGLPVMGLSKLAHPDAVVHNTGADAITYRQVFGFARVSRLRRAWRALSSPWTYSAIIRRIPVIGLRWSKWRAKQRARPSCASRS